MKDGFLKAAALSPALRVADCAYNVRQITEALRKAAARGVKLAVFPEFCLTGSGSPDGVAVKESW